MKTEISRDSHQPEKRYSGVYQQQGRMLTDADWNELVEILKDRLNDALKDVVGSREHSIGGTPKHRALKVIEDGANIFKIHSGHVYVDGMAAQVPGEVDIAYGAQPDFPSPPKPTGDYVLYADVWERTVTHLMDERLRDKGLHGADTCTRKQTVCQVKWCPDNADPEKLTENPGKGDSKLTVTLLQKTVQPDSCDPCVAELGVESKVGNYLFRVEVHDVQGDANDPSGITLKWSGENAAEQYALKNTEGNDVEPPDEFKTGQWAYEFFDETSEQHLGVHLAPGFAPSRGELDKGYPNTVPTCSFVRRWDGFCKLEKNAGSWKVADEFDRNQSGTESLPFTGITSGKLTVNLDARTLILTLNSSFVAGDYWLAEVREAEHEAGDTLMTDETPHGIEHHYLTLGKVVGGALQPNPEADRKYAFPPLTEMTRIFMAGGDGQEVMPGQPLPQPLRVGVANGEWSVKGATVRFQIEAGGGSLSPVNGGKTNVDGVAECIWTPDSAIGAECRVKAALVDQDHANDYIDPPVYFYANLITADQVAYTPACPDCGENSVRSQLATDMTVSMGVGADGYYTVKEVLDKLLCEFNASHLPIDKDDDDLCGRLKVEGIETVQDALDSLCSTERGCGCEVTVGENGGQYFSLKEAFDALAKEESVSLCLMPGNHQVDTGLDITGKNSIKISGAGSQGSVIKVQGNMKLAADEIQFKDVGVDIASFKHGISLKGGSICADGCGFKRTDLPKNIHIWSKNFKSTGREYGQGVAVDPQGNMLVTGYFTGKVDFGGQELTAVGEDLFVVKLSPRGELIWVRNYSNTGNEHGLGIAVDSKGCVLVTGHFDGDVVFGDYIFTSTGTDLFVLKLEPEAGAVIWARNLKSSGSEEGHGVAVDDQENVLVTGYFDGVRDADGNGLIANGTDLFVVKLDPKEGTVIWAHNFKSKGNQHGMGIAADLKGNVFLTGYFDGKVTFGEFKLEAKGIDLFVIKLEPKEGTVIWAHNYKSEGNEHGMGIAVDPKGHVILTGYFDGKVTFGEFKLSAEGMDMFVVKLEPETDKVLWANNYTPTGDNYGMAVAVDDGGNVFVTGYFNAKMIVGELNKKPSGEDMFVLKLNPEGKEIWVKQFGGAGNQRGLGISVYKRGAVYVTGYFSGHADFGGKKLSATGVDMFAFMLKPQRGDVSWVRNFANVSDEHISAIAVDNEANVLVTGKFTGAVDFGGHKLVARDGDLFVLKLRPDGEVVWAKNYKGTVIENGYGITTDPKGNIIVTGCFNGEIEFGVFKLATLETAMFVFKVSPEGKVIWAQNYKGSGGQIGYGVTVDADSNVLVTGIYSGTVEFGGFTLHSEDKDIDMFVLKLSSEGKVVWAHSYMSRGLDMGYGVAVDADGCVFVTGRFNGEIIFGTFTLKSKDTDLFVVKLSPDGELIWAHSYHSEGNEYSIGIAVDHKGYVILTGFFDGKVAFGEFILSADAIDMFVLKLSPDGEVVWARNYHSIGLDRGVRVAVDAVGHVLVIGNFTGEVDFDGRPLISDGSDMFVLKLSPEGRVVWAHNFDSTGNEYGNGIAVDLKGNVLAAGSFDGKIDFGGGFLTSVGTDLFIAKLAIPGAAPPLVEVRPETDKEKVDLNWNRNTMQMPPAGDAVANPGLRLDGIFDALALSDSTIGGNLENNRISGKVILVSDLPDNMDINPEGTVVRRVITSKKPSIAQSVLYIRSNVLNSIYSRIPLGALQNRILKDNVRGFGTMMISNNTFRENDSSFFAMRMTMTGNQFIGAVNHSDVAAIVVGKHGTFSDNQAYCNAMIQRVLTSKKQSSNDLNFQDLIGFIKNERLVLLNGEETPASTVMSFSADQPPDGWMECDGSSISRAEYAALFDVIGIKFGAGDNSTTFGIPDLSSANVNLMLCIKY